MLKKITYLVIGSLIFFVKDGFCDPISAGAAIFSALSTVGAALGPAGVLAAGGIGLEAATALNKPKMPGQPDPIAKPNPDDAAETANASMVSSRRALLLSGGETNLTGVNGAPLLGPDLSSKSLIGAG